MVRWRRPNASAPIDGSRELKRALASRPEYALAPAGCDDAKNECYVREASVEWLERAWSDTRRRGHATILVGATADESGPPRYLLVTTVARMQYSYALLFELHEAEWREHETMLREAARNFDADELP